MNAAGFGRFALHCGAVALARADMIADTLLVADRTSYRPQIHDGAGRAAVHVARVLGARLAVTTASAAARDTAATLPQARIASPR